MYTSASLHEYEQNVTRILANAEAFLCAAFLCAFNLYQVTFDISMHEVHPTGTALRVLQVIGVPPSYVFKGSDFLWRQS